MGALNEPLNEIKAPLASQEDLNDNIKYSDDLSDDIDIKRGLLQDSQEENKYEVIIKQPSPECNHTKEHSTTANSGDERRDSQNEKSYKAERLDKEISKTGSIGKKLYLSYVHAGASLFGIMVLIITTMVSHALFRFTDSWLSVWTNKERVLYMHNLTSFIEQYNGNGSMPSDIDLNIEEFNNINEYYLVVYGSSVLALIACCFVMIYRFFIMCINASRNLHNQMFNR